MTYTTKFFSNTLIMPVGSKERYISLGNPGEPELYRIKPVCGGIGDRLLPGFHCEGYRNLPDVLIYIQEGAVHTVFNNVEYVAGKGSVFFYPASEQEYFYNDFIEPVSMNWFHFRRELGNVLPGDLPQQPFLRQAVYAEEIKLLCELLYLEERRSLPTCETTIHQILQYLELEFSDSNAEHLWKRSKLNTVFSTVREDLRRDWQVAELAKMACMSESYFFVNVKTIYGYSPIELIRQIRLETAASLLIRTDNSLNEIAFRVGYGDAFAFSKAFRKKYGLSPRSYQRAKCHP